MAICVIEPKVGQYVYKHCQPQKPGIIRIVHGKTMSGYFYSVSVQWLDSSRTVTEEDTAGLKDFSALIEDHRKKLNTHESKLALLEKMIWNPRVIEEKL
jgi:hypothetical protein